MPRIKTYDEDRVQIQIRLPLEIRERLEEQALKRQMSKNLLMEVAIGEALDRWEKDLPRTATAAPAKAPAKTAPVKTAPVKAAAKRPAHKLAPAKRVSKRSPVAV